MLRIFRDYAYETSILDAFSFYESREENIPPKTTKDKDDFLNREQKDFSSDDNISNIQNKIINTNKNFCRELNDFSHLDQKGQLEEQQNINTPYNINLDNFRNNNSDHFNKTSTSQANNLSNQNIHFHKNISSTLQNQPKRIIKKVNSTDNILKNIKNDISEPESNNNNDSNEIDEIKEIK